MTVTSALPGIPGASRLAGWIGGESAEPAEPAGIGLIAGEFAAGYAPGTGRDISRIGYYVAFGYFRLAVVLEDIYARYLHQTVGDGFEHEGLAVPTLVARAHQVLDAGD
jgi:aminoglycoside phosphotransferase (APT) family kinase protein